MNERIKELWLDGAQSLWPRPGKCTAGEYDYNLEKFAELIVKKIDDILLLQQLDCIGNHDKKSAELIEQIRDKTKTYFGVEE
jgi:hypothetical protein